jgi:hypothetical protein
MAYVWILDAPCAQVVALAAAVAQDPATVQQTLQSSGMSAFPACEELFLLDDLPLKTASQPTPARLRATNICFHPLLQVWLRWQRCSRTRGAPAMR